MAADGRTYLIVGAGKFGQGVARALAERGARVIAVDCDDERLAALCSVASKTVRLDATDELALAEAARGADVAIVTSDNPRTEDPAAIIRDITAGMRAREGAVVEVIENRRDAIRRAVALARKGDVVLVAGKGHEGYQIVGSEKVHFDDREEVLAAVADLRSGRL